MSEKTTKNSRVCVRCKTTCEPKEFIRSPSKYMPGKRSIFCISCLEKMCPADDLNEVDKLMRWLDIPFMVDKWTQLYKIHYEHTLSAYAIMVEAGEYQALDWSYINEKWKEAIKNGEIENHIDELDAEKMRSYARTWGKSRTEEDYLYLQDLYDGILATQNVSTAIQRDNAKRLCESALNAMKEIRAGESGKDSMAVYHNILKACNFQPSNAKNAGDFESVGEIFAYYEKKGWSPTFAQNLNQDAIDYEISDNQSFLRRLVLGEGNVNVMVETRKKQYETLKALEEDDFIVKYNGEQTEDDITFEDDIEVKDDD